VVAYIEGGVNYWRNGHTQLIKKIYINRDEVDADPTCAARYAPNGDPWYNVLDYPARPTQRQRAPRSRGSDRRVLDGVDDDANGYVDDVSGWDFYNSRTTRTRRTSPTATTTARC
jgi:hypothetical protein